jgi:L-seryl-tRNA(Ser) seleniumtransferase
MGPAEVGISADRLLAALRAGTPAIVGRIEDGRAIFDLRTVDPARDETLAQSLRTVIAAGRRRCRPVGR